MLQMLRKLLPGGGKPAHERRRLAPSGPCPRVGATIVRRGVQMRISESISTELWNWLLLAGWREVRMSRNRRHYREVPPDTLHRLVLCGHEEWESAHRELLGDL